MDDGVDPNIKTKQDINYNRNITSMERFCNRKIR